MKLVISVAKEVYDLVCLFVVCLRRNCSARNAV